jgi:hypothetical protein
MNKTNKLWDLLFAYFYTLRLMTFGWDMAEEIEKDGYKLIIFNN